MATAQIIDPAPEETQETQEQNQFEDAQAHDLPLEEVIEEPAAAEEDDLPEKYRGKSIKELAQMHQEAEKALGRQSNEVGDLRKVVDDYIESQAQQAPQREVEPEEELDYFTDPQAAVNRAIENHPSVRAAEESTKENNKATAQALLQSKHGDMQEILADPSFAEWIQASKVRTRLFVEADQGYDVDAADELFTTWKERKSIVAQTAEVEKKARKQSVKQASTGGASGNPEGTGRKIYRRADIRKLMVEQPDRYAALQDEIFAAYRENRVR